MNICPICTCPNDTGRSTCKDCGRITNSNVWPAPTGTPLAWAWAKPFLDSRWPATLTRYITSDDCAHIEFDEFDILTQLHDPNRPWWCECDAPTCNCDPF